MTRPPDVHAAAHERAWVPRSRAGNSVVLELSPEHAEVLAHLLAHYDAIASAYSANLVVAGYEPDVWIQTVVGLLTEVRRLGPVAEEVRVPLLRAEDLTPESLDELAPVYFTPEHWAAAVPGVAR